MPENLKFTLKNLFGHFLKLGHRDEEQISTARFFRFFLTRSTLGWGSVDGSKTESKFENKYLKEAFAKFNL